MDASTDGLTTRALADAIEGELDGPGDLCITGVASLEDAGPGHISFLASQRYARAWGTADAGAAVMSGHLDPVGHDPTRRTLIRVPDAELAMARLLAMFAPAPSRPDPGVHATAVVHDTVVLGADPCLGAHVSIGPGSVLGNRVVLHPGARLGGDVCIGNDTEIHANVVVGDRCRIGAHVLLHAGVVIGADGFGFLPDPERDGLLKVPQIGTVEIADHVEIGANTCVDRGKFGATTIGEGTKIDNLVQLGHNVVIGRHTVIAGCTAIGGSVRIGDFVRCSGQVGIIDHVVVGDGVEIAAMSGVIKDVPAGERVAGMPADKGTRMLRQWAAVRRLPDLIASLSKHERA